MADLTKKKEKLGLLSLAAIVLSAMIGGGIFDLPKNMATNAGAQAQIIAWTTVGIGMWFVTSMFLKLSELKPNLTTGLYKYGEAGFGKFTGFFVSWGYWISECFSNVAYAVLLMSTLNYFFPGKFTGGNNWLSVIISSIILWMMAFVIIVGVKQASWVNVVGTVGRLTVIMIFIVVLAIHFKWDVFTTNFSAVHAMPSVQDPAMGSIPKQVLKTMTVTLWAFGGIEGAVVLSDRAKSQKDVKKATALGFFVCLVLYVLVSLLPLGLISYGIVAKMVSPSSAQLLSLALHNPAGRLIMAGGLIISVFSSWLTWTMMLAEMPYAAAKDGAFPKIFKKENKNQVPVVSLIIATIIMQGIIFVSHYASNAFEMAYTIVATMTVPPYLASAMYLIKISVKKELYPAKNGRTSALITGILAAIYILIMGISAGVKYITISFVIYALGIPLFIKARKESALDEPIFTKYEKVFAAIIVLIAIMGIIIMFS
ncbi:basic amino acid/polyamine antiporter [Ligilactobacillus sp. LYQ135]